MNPAPNAARVEEGIRARLAGWVALLALACALGGCAVPPDKPRSGLARIDHIVVIYAENRSFDNLYGLFPGADGIANARGGSSPARIKASTVRWTPALAAQAQWLP